MNSVITANSDLADQWIVSEPNTQTCMSCVEPGGLVVKCCHDNCKIKFHLDCAFQDGYFKLLFNTVKFQCECQEHYNPPLFCSCKKPYDSHRAYICCESCNEWYHAECAQARDEDLKDENFHFICTKCKKRSTWHIEEIRAANNEKEAISSVYIHGNKAILEILHLSNHCPIIEEVSSIDSKPLQLATVGDINSAIESLNRWLDAECSDLEGIPRMNTEKIIKEYMQYLENGLARILQWKTEAIKTMKDVELNIVIDLTSIEAEDCLIQKIHHGEIFQHAIAGLENLSTITINFNDTFFTSYRNLVTMLVETRKVIVLVRQKNEVHTEQWLDSLEKTYSALIVNLRGSKSSTDGYGTTVISNILFAIVQKFEIAIRETKRCCDKVKNIMYNSQYSDFDDFKHYVEDIVRYEYNPAILEEAKNTIDFLNKLDIEINLFVEQHHFDNNCNKYIHLKNESEKYKNVSTSSIKKLEYVVYRVQILEECNNILSNNNRVHLDKLAELILRANKWPFCLNEIDLSSQSSNLSRCLDVTVNEVVKKLHDQNKNVEKLISGISSDLNYYNLKSLLNNSEHITKINSYLNDCKNLSVETTEEKLLGYLLTSVITFKKIDADSLDDSHKKFSYEELTGQMTEISSLLKIINANVSGHGSSRISTQVLVKLVNNAKLKLVNDKNKLEAYEYENKYTWDALNSFLDECKSGAAGTLESFDELIQAAKQSWKLDSSISTVIEEYKVKVAEIEKEISNKLPSIQDVDKFDDMARLYNLVFHHPTKKDKVDQVTQLYEIMYMVKCCREFCADNSNNIDLLASRKLRDSLISQYKSNANKVEKNIILSVMNQFLLHQHKHELHEINEMISNNSSKKFNVEEIKSVLALCDTSDYATVASDIKSLKDYNILQDKYNSFNADIDANLNLIKDIAEFVTTYGSTMSRRESDSITARVNEVYFYRSLKLSDITILNDRLEFCNRKLMTGSIYSESFQKKVDKSLSLMKTLFFLHQFCSKLIAIETSVNKDLYQQDSIIDIDVLNTLISDCKAYKDKSPMIKELCENILEYLSDQAKRWDRYAMDIIPGTSTRSQTKEYKLLSFDQLKLLMLDPISLAISTRTRAFFLSRLRKNDKIQGKIINFMFGKSVKTSNGPKLNSNIDFKTDSDSESESESDGEEYNDDDRKKDDYDEPSEIYHDVQILNKLNDELKASLLESPTTSALLDWAINVLDYMSGIPLTTKSKISFENAHEKQVAALSLIESIPASVANLLKKFNCFDDTSTEILTTKHFKPTIRYTLRRSYDYYIFLSEQYLLTDALQDQAEKILKSSSDSDSQIDVLKALISDLKVGSIVGKAELSSRMYRFIYKRNDGRSKGITTWKDDYEFNYDDSQSDNSEYLSSDNDEDIDKGEVEIHKSKRMKKNDNDAGIKKSKKNAASSATVSSNSRLVSNKEAIKKSDAVVNVRRNKIPTLNVKCIRCQQNFAGGANSLYCTFKCAKHGSGIVLNNLLLFKKQLCSGWLENISISNANDTENISQKRKYQQDINAFSMGMVDLEESNFNVTNSIVKLGLVFKPLPKSSETSQLSNLLSNSKLSITVDSDKFKSRESEKDQQNKKRTDDMASCLTPSLPNKASENLLKVDNEKETRKKVRFQLEYIFHKSLFPQLEASGIAGVSVMLAYELEDAMFKKLNGVNQAYGDKSRMFIRNLPQKHNNSLVLRLAKRERSVEYLLDLSPDDLADPSTRNERIKGISESLAGANVIASAYDSLMDKTKAGMSGNDDWRDNKDWRDKQNAIATPRALVHNKDMKVQDGVSMDTFEVDIIIKDDDDDDEMNSSLPSSPTNNNRAKRPFNIDAGTRMVSNNNKKSKLEEISPVSNITTSPKASKPKSSNIFDILRTGSANNSNDATSSADTMIRDNYRVYFPCINTEKCDEYIVQRPENKKQNINFYYMRFNAFFEIFDTSIIDDIEERNVKQLNNSRTKFVQGLIVPSLKITGLGKMDDINSFLAAKSKNNYIVPLYVSVSNDCINAYNLFCAEFSKPNNERAAICTPNNRTASPDRGFYLVPPGLKSRIPFLANVPEPIDLGGNLLYGIAYFKDEGPKDCSTLSYEEAKRVIASNKLKSTVVEEVIKSFTNDITSESALPTLIHSFQKSSSTLKDQIDKVAKYCARQTDPRKFLTHDLRNQENAYEIMPFIFEGETGYDEFMEVFGNCLH